MMAIAMWYLPVVLTRAGAGPNMGSGGIPTGPMTMGPQAGPGPRGPMGSGSLGVGAMNNSLLPGGMGVSAKL